MSSFPPRESLPAVTVLMTVFNAAKHLRSAMKSILAQSFRDFEFLLIDDGSTDDSVEIARSFTDARIRLVLNPENRGQTLCLNQGLALARAPWIARQDADDWAHPERLARQMATLRNEPDLGLLGTAAWLVTEEGKFAGLLNVPPGRAGVDWAAIFENPFVHTAVIFRKTLVAEIGGYDPEFRICQDYDLWERLLQIAPARNLPDRLVTYRVSPHSLQHRNREVVDTETTRVLERTLKRTLPDLALGEADLALLLAFRGGLPEKRRHAFRLLMDRLQRAYLHRFPELKWETSFRRTRALHEAKLARDLVRRDWPAMSVTAARAFFWSPRAVLGLAADRVFGAFSDVS